jgi:hypothetical protein
MAKILITGTPRSGTQWLIAMVQVAAGWVEDDKKAWVRHEPATWRAYREPEMTNEHMKDVVLKDPGPYVEINAYANEGMIYWNTIGGRIVHLVRDPHDTARSIVRARLNIVGVRYDMEELKFHNPTMQSYMDYDAALHYWAETHARIMRWPVHMRVRIEDLWTDFDKFCAFINEMFKSDVSSGWVDHQRQWLIDNQKAVHDSHGALPYPDVPDRLDMPAYIQEMARMFGYS